MLLEGGADRQRSQMGEPGGSKDAAGVGGALAAARGAGEGAAAVMA
jgi:hypothetical protein